MINYIIATHGSMASGVKHTLSILIGEKENLLFIDAYTNNIPLEEQIHQLLSCIPESDSIVIFTDLTGGSVNQTVLRFLGDTRIHVISGFNLALILELMLTADEEALEQSILSSIELAKEQMNYINQLLKEEKKG